MSAMQKTGGYITVEMSLILPMVLFALLLLMGYVCYFMNCGVVQGTMEEISAKGTDTFQGGDYDTGEISYARLNQRNLYTEMFPGKEPAAGEVKKQLKQELSAHLFLGRISDISVSSGMTQIKVQVETSFSVPGASFLEMFGIRVFQHKGTYEAPYLEEMEKVRGWSVIEGTMD